MGLPEYSIQRIPLDNVGAFLIHRPGNAILVDCGNCGSESAILESLSNLGLDPGMLKLLVLTHVHFDHAGSAAKMKELTGCRILVHKSEKEKLRQGFTSIPAGTRWKARILTFLGRIFRPRIGRFPGTEPDILSEKRYDLGPFGFPGEVIHTPGHTHGSQVILMAGGEMIAGDTFFGLPGKQHFPPFAEDLPALVESWKSIRTMPVTRIYPAHGRSVPFSSFLAEFDDAMKRYG